MNLKRLYPCRSCNTLPLFCFLLVSSVLVFPGISFAQDFILNVSVQPTVYELDELEIPGTAERAEGVMGRIDEPIELYIINEAEEPEDEVEINMHPHDDIMSFTLFWDTQEYEPGEYSIEIRDEDGYVLYDKTVEILDSEFLEFDVVEITTDPEEIFYWDVQVEVTAELERITTYGDIAEYVYLFVDGVLEDERLGEIGEGYDIGEAVFDWDIAGYEPGIYSLDVRDEDGVVLHQRAVEILAAEFVEFEVVKIVTDPDEIYVEHDSVELYAQLERDAHHGGKIEEVIELYVNGEFEDVTIGEIEGGEVQEGEAIFAWNTEGYEAGVYSLQIQDLDGNVLYEQEVIIHRPPIIINVLESLDFGVVYQGDGPRKIEPVDGPGVEVEGDNNTEYSIDLPEDVVLTHENNNGTLTASNFKHNAGENPEFGEGGEDIFYIGATLEAVDEEQTVGAYSGTGTVTVSYAD